MKILITGFDPFDEDIINPSWEVVQSLPESVEGHVLIKKQLATVFNRSFEQLKEVWDKENPDIVIAVGQAGGRESISVERVAINLDDARIADNEGNQPVDSPVRHDGENAYFSNLPVKKMIQRAVEKGIPVSLSYSAGTFVCNHIMYQILHAVKTEYPHVKGGFIHVPFLPEQAAGKKGVPSMSADTIKEGLILLIKGAVMLGDDVHIPMGSEC